jgi:L-asparagine transporter-like permease
MVAAMTRLSMDLWIMLCAGVSLAILGVAMIISQFKKQNNRSSIANGLLTDCDGFFQDGAVRLIFILVCTILYFVADWMEYR